MLDEAQANRPHEISGRTVEPKRAVPRNVRINVIILRRFTCHFIVIR